LRTEQGAEHTPYNPEPGGGRTSIVMRPELAMSRRPIVGALIDRVRRVLVGGQQRVMADLASQLTDLASQLNTSIGSLETRVQQSDEHRILEIAAREHVQCDVRDLSVRLEGIAGDLESLQLRPRLARLERSGRLRPTTDSPVAPPNPQPLRQNLNASATFDYLAFEARFRGTEETIRTRQRFYLDELAFCKRVADLGCGRGELLELLREHSIPAYGVELEADFVDLLREKDLEVVTGDALAHLGELPPGSLDGIVASHVIEHMPAAIWQSLVLRSFDALRPSGVMILETPNPESLVAGSINFHRDPTHLRPVHPETLAFHCESAGFSTVEIRRLAEPPPEHRLPHLKTKWDGREEINAIIDRLNALLCGPQDYAVIARRS